MIRVKYYGFLLFVILLSKSIHAQQVDQDLLNSLKIEANHDLDRLKSLNGEKKNNKIYDNEREKGLGIFLEEQEKWDSLREKGLAEYRKQKKTLSPEESGPEHKADIKEKSKADSQFEQSRKIHVYTRDQVFSKNRETIMRLEGEELGLDQARPRYELRKRGKNKWVKNGSDFQKSSGGGAYSPTSGAENLPPPPPLDYSPVPPPTDGYEDIPPPPPPPNYEGGYGMGAPSPTYDAGYGEIPPPPPPPPVDYDF